ncbi:methylmalonyl-CoA mutase, partial [Prosthecomicrobium hirschii]
MGLGGLNVRLTGNFREDYQSPVARRPFGATIIRSLAVTVQPATLLENFPPVTEEQWRAAVAKALKGSPFERLRRMSPEGIPLEPLYRGDRNGRVTVGGHAGQPWTVIQRIEIPDPAEANRIILADLEGGAGGLELVFADGTGARPHGLGARSEGDFDRLFEGVLLDLIRLRVDAGAATAETVAAIEAAAERRGIAPAALSIDRLVDPIGRLAACGRLSETVEAAIRAAAGDASKARNGTLLEADGRIAHAAGANDLQELAALLSTAVAYWRGLVEAGLEPDRAARLIGFTIVADQDQFRTIAKLRALRRLWANALEAAGVGGVPARIHAETAWRMMSRIGSQTNLLRTTIAAFAAGLGGADSVAVLPFTAAVGLPDDFARRLARNTQTILLEESNLWRVADPAAGSGLVETETNELAERAWILFQQIEAEGGILALIRKGQWQERVAAVATEREKAIARRKLPLTGVSEFPDISERPVAVLDRPAAEPAEFDPAETAVAMPARRLGAAFEQLRSAAATAAPTVFLANIGRIPDFNARATWAKNLFEAGGIAALGNDGFADEAALVEAFRASGTGLACLCSSDALYAEAAERIAGALKAAGATLVILAGKPADGETEMRWRTAGIDLFVHVGIDVAATLKGLLARAGVA